MLLVAVSGGVLVIVGTVAVKVKVGGIGVSVGVELGGAGVGVCVEVGYGVGIAIFPVTIAPALLNPITAIILKITIRLPKV